MHSVTAQRLVAINRHFYTEFGDSFAATRGRIQPGVSQILRRLNGAERILDLGCGNGQLARALAGRGHLGSYLGLDFSLPLLDHASLQSGQLAATFRQADLATSGWAEVAGRTGPGTSTATGLQSASFDLIFAFAVLHHIPGDDLRLDILRHIHGLLANGGIFAHSEWQFLNSAKMRARIQPWEKVGMSATELDPGDTLLDWRQGGMGLRYVHHFSEPELAALAAQSGFRILETFSSDGQGGRLSLYQLWERTEPG